MSERRGSLLCVGNGTDLRDNNVSQSTTCIVQYVLYDIRVFNYMRQKRFSPALSDVLCVCVCVCVRERERERVSERASDVLCDVLGEY